MPFSMSVTGPVSSAMNERTSPGSAMHMHPDENTFLTSVSRHFDSTAVDSILKGTSINKPQT